MTIHSVLKKHFGYDHFRSGQEQLIEAILQGKDVLGIMPTGAGKSICFQVPATLMPGITLVISPLISLMKDQVETLLQVGIPAAFINSSLTYRQTELALENARNGTYKIIYVAPERLLVPEFLQFAQSSPISMLTVDEAHCISQWGQDFRPSYARIPEFIAALPQRPVVSAFTATATPRVREDIASLLQLQNPEQLITGFDRENLYFEVQSPQNKMSALTAFLENKKEKSGIVYCSTRSTVESVCDALNDKGFSASRYHAGLSDRERRKNQDDFLYDRVQIMVATNAFGMGIDKSNVSFVVHYNMPKDIESYYQEAGRAGRDGSLADCLLLYSKQDYGMNLWMIENAKKSESSDPDTEELIKERDKKRLRDMTFYCNTGSCLRGFILKYFGEKPPQHCNNCGNCHTKLETIDITIDAQKILSCVARMRGHYGADVVADVLLGQPSETISELGLEKLSTYGIWDKDRHALDTTIEYLLQMDCLVKNSNAALGLGPAAKEVLTGGTTLHRKVEQETLPTPDAKDPGSAALSALDQQLLSKLTQLRQQIAGSQNVPAYVVFSNQTLSDMCRQKPLTQRQFLQISGVGEMKLWRYGKPFLALLQEDAVERKKNPSADTDSADKPSSSRSKSKRKEESLLPLAELADSPEQNNLLSQIALSEEPIGISQFAKSINSVFSEHGYEKISAIHLSDRLLAAGLLQIPPQSETQNKEPTQLGEKVGMIQEERSKPDGTTYRINLYPPHLQRLIVNHLPSLFKGTAIEWEKADKAGAFTG
ncbi:DNA helicase RecQ [Clostridium minihomine]|uniref:DNA helicase RecQ n=1 Tax=Clostridium minihomine TaxID=2045012 RepID=UPI000C7906AE|nr:DNA helicase RecQ [Clostridium minihomine]